jgi:hypothetical protein
MAAVHKQAWDQTSTALVAGGLAIVGGLTLATKAAMDWESAWTGVLKTVDGYDAQLAAVEDGLRGLAKTLPFTHTQIAGVAESYCRTTEPHTIPLEVVGLRYVLTIFTEVSVPGRARPATNPVPRFPLGRTTSSQGTTKLSSSPKLERARLRVASLALGIRSGLQRAPGQPYSLAPLI